MESFADFHLIGPLAKALEESGYTKPTPIQEEAIPLILKRQDVVGIAQTGTGKTAAFVIPILQYLELHKKPSAKGTPRVIILVPTRELATQVGESVKTYGKHLGLTHTTIFGGVPQGPQEHALAKGIDVIIATPGRLLDLMRQRFVHANAVEVLVLDEADRMLEMGFAEDIKLIAKEVPEKRQTLLFSATMSPRIIALTHNYLTNPTRIAITPEATTVGKVKQSVLFVDKEDKIKLLLRLLENPDVHRALVFVRMKHTADKLVGKLVAEGMVSDALHSDRTQAMRTQILENFRAGKTRVLVATDIAARGLDVDGITHVFNFDLPKDPETYVHRIGRTARAGANGHAISFCSGDDRANLAAIEKLIAKTLTVKEHKFHSRYAQDGGVMKSTEKKTAVNARTGKGGGRSKLTSVHKARQAKGWRQE